MGFRLGIWALVAAGLIRAISIAHADDVAADVVAGPPTGLADSAALHATVFGTPPQDVAPLPERVPVAELRDLARIYRDIVAAFLA